jgi:hypothetical protein
LILFARQVLVLVTVFSTEEHATVAARSRETVVDRRQAMKLFASFALYPLCARAAFAMEHHWRYGSSR